MKIKTIADKTDKELVTLVDEQKAKLADLNIKYRTAKVANVREIRNVRQAIARALTILRERELAKEEGHE